MKIGNLKVGPIQTNCYLVEDGGELVIVDPGAEVESIVAAVDGRPVKEIWVTHGHWDHVEALAGVEARLGAPCAMSAGDADLVDGKSRLGDQDIALGYPAPHVDRRLHEGDEVSVGSCTFRVIETPGHTPGSICYWCEAEHLLFAGDTLFAGGGFGRTDFPGGSFDSIVRSMKGKLSQLPDETVVLSGHGPRSTIGVERSRNPYL